jgi:hypothetical protein
VREAAGAVESVLLNAMKFTPPQGAAAVTAEACADGGITFDVPDGSVGIAQETSPDSSVPHTQTSSRNAQARVGSAMVSAELPMA